MFARAPLALRSRSALTAKRSLVIIISFAAAAMAQLPVISINTADGTTMNSESGWGCTNTPPNSMFGGNMMASPRQNYVPLTVFTISGAGDFNKSNIATASDSMRIRGNSTASTSKKPYRIKFSNKTSLLGIGQSKSWVLLASYHDGSLMLGPLAFELSRELGIEGTREYRHVILELNGNKQGVYILTQQISGSADGGIDVKPNKGGWLVEFDFHEPSDSVDCRRYFTTSQYSMNTKIRAPEEDNTEFPGFDYLKNDINEMVNRVQQSSAFPSDIMDIKSWSRYLLIQKFMDNSDFILTHAAGGGFLPGGGGNSDPPLGSNYAYKIQTGEKIKAGPIWDFDLAAGYRAPTSSMGGTRNYNNYQWRTGEPEHPFYKKLWSDRSGFLTEYESAWEEHKCAIKAFADDGGKIDSLMNRIAPAIQGNTSEDLRSASEDSYKQHIGNLKTWWKNRYTYFDEQMPRPSGKASGSCDNGSSGDNGNDGDNGNGDNTVTVNNNTITIRKTPDDGGDVTWTVNSNSITLTAQAAENYRFTGWAVETGQLPSTMQPNDPTSETITFTVNSTRTMIANFELLSSVKANVKMLPNGKNIMIMNNAVNLNVNKSATIRIVNLNGREVRKAKLTSGNHTVRLNDLPKGLYLINATIDGKKHTLRAPVK